MQGVEKDRIPGEIQTQNADDSKGRDGTGENGEQRDEQDAEEVPPLTDRLNASDRINFDLISAPAGPDDHRGRQKNRRSDRKQDRTDDQGEDTAGREHDQSQAHRLKGNPQQAPKNPADAINEHSGEVPSNRTGQKWRRKNPSDHCLGSIHRDHEQQRKTHRHHA